MTPVPLVSRRTALGAFLALSLLLAGCAPYPIGLAGAADRDEVTRRSDLVYTPPAWPEALAADVYLPRDDGDGLRPAALVVHGGGWQRRDRSDMAAIAAQLADRGYVAINIDHRFAPEHRFPAQLHDLQRAMRWIHDNAAAWRIDTRRIVGVGYSSGAHLVSLLGVIEPDNPLSEPYGGEHTRLAAVLAGGTPTDLFKFDDGRLVVDFLGGTRAEVPTQYWRASPIRQLGEAPPPFFLFHGRLDSLVPVDHARDFHAALRKRGSPSRLFLQPLRGHLTAFITAGTAIEEGIDFLDRQIDHHPGMTPAPR